MLYFCQVYTGMGVIITKAKTLHCLADKIIRPYTMYVIVRENFEHKDFKQGLWEMWGTIGTILDAGLDDEKTLKMIDIVSSKITDEYWQYVDRLLCEIQNKQTGQEIDISVNLHRIESMKRRNIIDERALMELRLIEESVY